MEGHADKRRCCHQSKLTVVNLALNILLIMAVGFSWVHFSLKFERLTQDNDRLRSYPVSSDKTGYPCDIPDEDSRSEAGLQIRREILSPIETFSNVPTMKEELASVQAQIKSVQAQINKLEKLTTRYHPDFKDINCPRSYRLNPYTGTCFRYLWLKYNWHRASDYCERYGGHLATFDTIESAAWFRHQQVAVGWGSNSWIGGSRQYSKIWEWKGLITGNINLGYWAPNQPSSKDQQCMVTWKGYDFYWDDHPCKSEENFACEKKM